MQNLLLLMLVIIPLGAGAQDQDAQDQDAQDQDKNWEAFTLQELIGQQVQSQKRYLPFLNQETISAGIYELKKGDVDQQQPHDKDEIYFILEGSSDFNVEKETSQVNTGDVLFVKAHLNHSFSNITEDLKILVWFSGSPQTDHDFMWKMWSGEGMAAMNDPQKNTWNVFLEVPTMITGLYSLPQKIGGDSVLTHQVDEINYVIKGKAKFAIGEEVIEVNPGSLVWVKAGIGHRFFDLEQDFEVYIMFEQH